MSKRKQLILLTWIQLFVLLFPMAIKEVHLHVGESHVTHSSGFVLQSYAKDHCEICDFEFVPFIPAEKVSVPTEPLYSSLVVASVDAFFVVEAATIDRLRAPPVCC